MKLNYKIKSKAIPADNAQLANLLKENSFGEILKETKRVLKFHYKNSSFSQMKRCAKLIKKLFLGKFSGYRECNTEYHNLDHTLAALLASVRLLDGYNLSNTPVTPDLALNLIIASLFHDTGYIQESWDNEGTGAKFTENHVQRSIGFLRDNYKKFKIRADSLDSIERLIKCTGLTLNFAAVPFQNDLEKIAGAMLGTADLIGQMADRAYLEKLLFLYYEFKEANVKGFNTEFDILKKTVDFYCITEKRLDIEYLKVYKYAKAHFKERFGIDSNLYIDAMQRQIEYLKKIIKDSQTNFRQKLKRGEWIHYIQSENIFINKMKFPTTP